LIFVFHFPEPSGPVFIPELLISGDAPDIPAEKLNRRSDGKIGEFMVFRKH